MPVNFKAPKPKTKEDEKEWAGPKTPLEKKKPRIASMAGKQAQAMTTVEHKDGSTEEQHENLPGFLITQATLCVVAVNASATINLGNYESIKIGVILSVPTEKKDIDVTFNETKKWVDEKMNEMTAEYSSADKTEE